MIKKIALTLGILIFTSYFLFAQSTVEITVYGHVYNSDNTPLENVNIIDLKTKKGASSNKHGYFSFTTTKQASTIKFSYVGFKSYNYELTNLNKLKNDSLRIDVYLTEEYSTLVPVEISSKNTHKVYSRPWFFVTDFEFVSNNLLLVINRNHSDYILYIDDNEDTLDILTSPARSDIYKDCFGNIDLVSNDSVRQLYFDEDDFMYIAYSSPIERFKNLVFPCVANINNKIITVSYNENNQAERFYYYDSSKKAKLLFQIKNNTKDAIAKNEIIRINDLKEYEYKYCNGSANMSESKSKLAIGREIFEREIIYKHILTFPIYNPVFTIHDSLYLFDHTDNRCYVFDSSLVMARTFSITYNNDKAWGKELLLDKIKNKIYAKYIKNGIIYLKEIDLNSGTIINELKVNDCIFPIKLAINNGYVYFIKNEIDYSNKTGMYKQKIQ